MVHDIRLTDRAKKDLKKVPTHVAEKLLAWVGLVAARGLEEVRKIPGYHDEPLKGQRAGERSIRLSKAYRAVYRIRDDDAVEFVSVEEVHKHDY